MGSKVISVIVPCYNVSPYLKRCVDSIVNQTYSELEIILVDDGSTDDTGRIIDEYADSDKRIVAIHRPNGGASAARNTGLEVSTGEFIAFVDSDDAIDLKMYNEMLKLSLSEEAPIVSCGYHIICDDFVKTYVSEEITCFESEEKLRTLFDYSISYVGSGPWNKLFRRDIIANQRFEENIVLEDIPFLIKIYQQKGKMACVNQAFYYYYKREGSASNSVISEARIRGLEKICEEILVYEGKCRRQLCVYGTRLISDTWDDLYTRGCEGERRFKRKRLRVLISKLLKELKCSDFNDMRFYGFQVWSIKRNCYFVFKILFWIISKSKIM